jgi:hypothetical protein
MYRLQIAAFSLTACLLHGAAAQEPAVPVSFTKDVAPILVKNCQACHGASDPKGGFQLHTFAALQKPGDSGSPPLTAGQPEASELFRRISTDDADLRMPQDSDPLPAEQIELLRRWIAEGAAFDGGDPQATLVSIIPKLPHPAAPEAYRVPWPVTAIAFRPDGQELAIGGYHEITIWNPADGALLRRIGNVDERTYALAYNADGSLLAAASGTPGVSGEIRLYEPASGNLVRELASLSDAAFDVRFSPAFDRLAACGADRSIRVFDVASGTQQLLIEDHADWVLAIAWNHDGTRLASASRDKTSKVFDAATGESLVTFPGHGDVVYGVAFSPDGTQVLTGGANRLIHVWNPADGNKIADVGGFGGEVFRLSVAGGLLAATGADRVARLFNVGDRAAVRNFEGHADWVFALSINEATRRLATGSFDGEVRIWNLDDGAAIATFKAAPGLGVAQTAQAQ